MSVSRLRSNLSIALLLLGSAVMTGWVLAIEPLKSVLPGFPTMKFNTALCFALVGAGLAATGSRTRAARTIAWSCGIATATIGLLTVIQYPLGQNFGIDQLVVPDTGTLAGSGFAGRMSPITAIAWMALGSAIILLASSRRRSGIVWAHGLAGFAAFIAFLAAAGYTFGAEAFWGIGPYTSIALHTAVGLLVAAGVGLMTRPDEGWLGGNLDSPGARRILLQLLPTAVMLPLLVGFLILLGSGLGAYNAAFGFALFVPLTTLGLVLGSLRAAARARADELELRRSEAQLHLAFGELRALNESLESQVEQRTGEREAAIAQLNEAKKLETLGQLTGGVAHDFNNLLTPILGSLDLLHRHHKDDERLGRLIESGLGAAERARVLVARLLSFARRQTLTPFPTNVGALVEGVKGLVEQSMGPQIGMAVTLPKSACVAFVDPHQVELAILNVALNARDAMPNGGTFRIDVETIESPGTPGLNAGRYVRISMADTGEGMDEATLARAVEPFFSTKQVGRGTGLGLSMVHGLCAQLGGVMTLSSTPGVGTRVELWLPEALDAPEPASELSRERTRPIAARRRLTLLLVDDEDLVRASTATILVDMGYDVIETASGEEALKILAGGDKIEAVLTDYLMPGMTGAELAAELARRRPSLPVLIVTGYAKAAVDIPAHVHRLGKPFRADELERAIRNCLDDPKGRVAPVALQEIA